MLKVKLTASPKTLRNDPVRVWGNRLFWLILCFSILINTGSLGSGDAVYRLRTSHWLWTGAPPVDAQDSNPFVLTGTNGTRHSWYGLGQSLLMLPGDMVGTLAIQAMSGVDAVQKNSKLVHEFVVVILTFPVLAAAASCSFYLLLVRLGLTVTEAFLSALVAVFATRLLNIMQIHQEDIQLFLFLTGATYWMLRWLDDKRGLFLGLAATCFGFNLITRLTTGIDVIVIAAAIVVLLVLEQNANWRDEIRTRARQVLFIFIPMELLFLLTDRVFHFYRFGEWGSTYLGLIANKMLNENPGWPTNWPWTYPFWKGFFEAFYSPFWGSIYFDPLFVVSGILFAVRWKYLPLRLKVIGAAFGVLWIIYAAFYARYYSPPGFWAWGNRYLSTPTILLSALAFPAWLHLRQRTSPTMVVIFTAILAWSTTIQLSSIIFHAGNELIQSGAGAVPYVGEVRTIDNSPIIFRRFENIVTMVRDGVLESEFQPHFFAVRGTYLKSGEVYVFTPHLRWGVLTAWVVTFSGLLALIIKFSRQAYARRKMN